jgi:hypothetical protein
VESEEVLRDGVRLEGVRKATSILFLRYLAILAQQEDTGTSFPAGTETSHLIWLCRKGAEAEELPVDKLSRWLGFVQGVMSSRGLISMETERDLSRPLFHAAYTAAGMKLPPVTGKTDN